MSTTTTTPTSSPRHSNRECNHCTHVIAPDCFYAPGYCSRYCYHAHQGRKVLTNIRDDHKFCFTCFKQLKTLERARSRDPDVFTGYQYPTEHARRGLVDRYPADSRIDIPDHADYTRIGIVCECGQTHHRSRESVIQETSFRDIVESLYYALHHFKQNGRHDYEITIQGLADALRAQSGIQGWDFELAVGHAIHQETNES